MVKKVTVLGTGAYGIALAIQFAKNNDQVVLWTEDNNKYNEFNKSHKFNNIFKDLCIPENINITKDLKDAISNTNIIVFVTATKYIQSMCKDVKKYYNNEPICIASKGIDHNTLSPLSTLVKKELHTNNICVISGPTFAVDLVNNNPCALAIAGLNKKCLYTIKESLENDNLKLRVSSDIIGIQLCGSLKNIIAIAAGILNGLGYQESTQSFLINESLHDIKLMIKKLGGKSKTILSFAGIGDLLLTCTSEKSRNYSFGQVIGRTKNKKEIDSYINNNTVEGYYTLKSTKKMLEKKGIEIPLINIIYDIVINGYNPNLLSDFLINKS